MPGRTIKTWAMTHHNLRHDPFLTRGPLISRSALIIIACLALLFCPLPNSAQAGLIKSNSQKRLDRLDKISFSPAGIQELAHTRISSTSHFSTSASSNSHSNQSNPSNPSHVSSGISLLSPLALSKTVVDLAEARRRTSNTPRGSRSSTGLRNTSLAPLEASQPSHVTLVAQKLPQPLQPSHASSQHPPAPRKSAHLRPISALQPIQSVGTSFSPGSPSNSDSEDSHSPRTGASNDRNESAADMCVGLGRAREESLYIDYTRASAPVNIEPSGVADLFLRGSAAAHHSAPWPRGRSGRGASSPHRTHFLGSTSTQDRARAKPSWTARVRARFSSCMGFLRVGDGECCGSFSSSASPGRGGKVHPAQLARAQSPWGHERAQ